MSKNILRVVAGMALAAALVAGYIASLYFRAGWQDDALAQKEKQLENNWKEVAALDAANDAKWNALEAQDTYGGATPDETWDMFVAALEKEDIELAAKYFRVDKQERQLNEFKEGMVSGGVTTFVGLIKSLKVVQKNTDARYSTFVTERLKETGTGMVFELEINKQTHVWKILSL